MDHQIDFSNYNLSGRDINQLAFIFHQNINNQKIISQMIKFFGFENLINTKHNGMVSKIIEYFINRSDEKMINLIVTKVESFDDFKFMKRDYLHLIKFYYDTDLVKSIEIFDKKVLSKSTFNTDYVIQTKDINFLIENKLFILLCKLKDVFIEASCDYDEYVDQDNINTELKSNELIHDSVLELINKNLSLDVKNYLETFWTSNNKDFNAIIDGGNVLHSVGGKINQESLVNLIKIVKQTQKMFGKSLLIIHRRHIKTFPNLISELKSTGITYYLTPYNVNDDIFILWFFLNIKLKPFIITNDKYRDHVFNFETINKKDNINLSMSQFKHVLSQQSLEYDVIKTKINEPVKVSKCIHLIENQVFVPHVSGKFIKIILY